MYDFFTFVHSISVFTSVTVSTSAVAPVVVVTLTLSLASSVAETVTFTGTLLISASPETKIFGTALPITFTSSIVPLAILIEVTFSAISIVVFTSFAASYYTLSALISTLFRVVPSSKTKRTPAFSTATVFTLVPFT